MKPPPRRIPKLGPPRSSPRERALSEWRGIDLTAEEKTREHREKPAGELVSGVLKHIRLESRRAEAEIVRVWNEVIDPSIAAHAQPVGINKGTLFVDVDSSVWLSEIVRYRRREILDRLQSSFGKELIARISFRAK
jgi:predicted nucleic acid-binding Zn ribbon protein